ncbi:hypothetical protein [Arsenicibacter rosenii]|uniref:Uncharacterized protein n=1 Tax=Arsenicibacter rosenii TaxID=1750698 RepID=A0A1S2VDW9_9BACT|nr:hypothetical protein [Arsenicibacter rosenii]OIN56475.1 hypothetical protein BLX24_24460 [Arsenicibacter rosenii]
MKNHVDLRIHSVLDIAFSVRHIDFVDPSRIAYQVSGKLLNVQPDPKLLGFETEVICAQQDENKDRVEVMRYVNQMTFYIENMEEVINESVNGKPKIDKALARILLDITIPTIRGILIGKTAGTGLEKCYLPLIKADKLIP